MTRLSIGASLLVLVMVRALAAWEDGTNVQELVDKAIQAAGGQDKLLTTFRWKEKYYIGACKEGVPREVKLTPPDHWWENGTDIAAGNPDRLEKTYLVWVWTLAPLLDKDSTLAALPDVKVDDRACVGLRLSRRDRPDIDLYFDAETSLLARIDWRKYQIHFSEWKELDGFKYPAQAFVRNADGSLSLRTELLELERLEPTADSGE